MKTRQKIFCALLFLIIAAICIMNGVTGGYLSDYYLVNGDFQNYNVVRRFLDGQKPGEDFACYLGLGHLWIGSAATLLFGFFDPILQSSIMAFDALPMAAFCLIAFLIFKTVFKGKPENALILTILALLAVMLTGHYGGTALYKAVTLNDVATSAFKEIDSTGNSARMLRGAAPAVFYLIYCAVNFIIRKTRFSDKSEILACGIAAGAIALYGNDYGIASAVVAFIAVFGVVLLRKAEWKDKLCRIALFCASVVVSFAVTGTLATFGNLGQYLTQVLGTGGAQGWYYFSDKSHFIYDIELSPVILVQLAVCLVYAVVIIIKKFDKEALQRFGLPLYFNLTAYAAANEYKLLSGNSLKEVATIILWLTLIAEAVAALLWLAEKINIRYIKAAVKICACVALVLGTVALTKDYRAEYTEKSSRDYMYIEEVGRLTKYGQDILDARERIPDDAVLFSTYASAVEINRGIYQPSGYDYIIHVLGEKAQQRYLEAFEESDPDYVLTLRSDDQSWEYWAGNTNWFFYRQLYRNYQPEYASQQHTYWKKKTEPHQPVMPEGEVVLTWEEPRNCRVEVFMDPSVTGTVDATISYNVGLTDSKRKNLILLPMIKLFDDVSYNINQHINDHVFNLPESGTYNIPIDVVDGYGCMYVKSYPKGGYTYIENIEVTLGELFTAGYEYIRINSLEESQDTLALCYTESPENIFLAQRSEKVLIDGNWFDITDWQDGKIFIRNTFDEQQLQQVKEFVRNYNCIKLG